MSLSSGAPKEAAETEAEPLFDAEFLHKLERLQLLARRRLRGANRGQHRSQRRGRGLEFRDFRHYQPGDDLRHIDWNIFSRLDRLVLKLFSASDDVSLYLLLDASASMAIGQPRKFDHARRLAAALGWIGLHGLDRVTVASFAAALGRPHRPGSSPRHMPAMLDYLTQLPEGGETGYTAALGDFTVHARRPGVVVLLSDLLASTDALDPLHALGPLRAAGHDIVVLQLLADEDITPAFDGAMALVDAEDGGTLRVDADATLRTAYTRALTRRFETTERYCARHGIEYLRTSTAVPFEDVVLRYLRDGSLLT